MSRRSCGSPSAGRAGTGPNRALVAAGRGIAVITGGAVGLEAVRWAFGAGAAAGLGYVTGSRRWPTHHAGGLEAIGWAEGTGADAGLGHITDSHRRPTHRARRLEAISRAEGTSARAHLGHITGRIYRPTYRARCLEAIGRAGGIHPVAGLGYITGPGCRATHRVRRLELTGGRATEARLPVIGSQVTLLGALHQPIATDGRANARITPAAIARLDGADAGAAISVCGVAIITLFSALLHAIAADGGVSNLRHEGVGVAAAESRLHGIHRGKTVHGSPRHIGAAGDVHSDALAEVTAT